MLADQAHIITWDLNSTTPYASRSMDAIVCHDVLEFLGDPQALLAEAARLLRGTATAVFSHTDYDGLIIRAGNRELTRTVCHAWADFPDNRTKISDAWMGRRVASLVHRSPLQLERIDTHVSVSTKLSGFARQRIRQIATALRDRATNGTGPLSVDEIDLWTASVEQAEHDREFFYAEIAFLVCASAGPN